MKNSFIVALGARLWLASWGITGLPAEFLAPFIQWFLGDLLDRGIFVMDLTLNAIKMGMQEERFKKLAEAAYAKATARIYTEDEKNAIRKQYLDAIRDFARFGNGPNVRVYRVIPFLDAPESVYVDSLTHKEGWLNAAETAKRIPYFIALDPEGWTAIKNNWYAECRGATECNAQVDRTDVLIKKLDAAAKAALAGEHLN